MGKKTTTKAKETVKKETKKKPAPKKQTKKEAVKKETKPSVQEAPKEFVSMCGAKFNSSPDSTCFLMCQMENKIDFQACLGHYEETAAAKQKHKLKRRKKIDYFGDGVGTSASMINSLLICGATMEEIQNELEIKKSRITGHFGGLKTGSLKTRPKAFQIFKCKETKRYYFDEDLPYYGDCDECGNAPAH